MSKIMIKNAIAAVIAVGLTSQALAQDTAEKPMEKCYGIAKAHRNDCGTKNHGCAGDAKMDNDPSEWVNMAAGSCEKAGGKLKDPTDTA